MMGLEMFAGQLEQFIEFTTRVAVGLLLIGLGVYLGNVAAKFVRDSGNQGADQLATVARVAIVIFAGAMGLERMGLSSSIVNVAFGSLLGGLGNPFRMGRSRYSETLTGALRRIVTLEFRDPIPPRLFQ
ncbi:hypothetical protein Pla22_32270 [Rubripirellula amarantea]|uniref:Uncharacterized protein n=2 Tax=Rubripirellula amarantea TaxID=2527999 RepID=A0A5C5WI52_9BACT|nr:hypothetical protein Pla22_32270 [Rubripirellula amarantea]